MAKKSKLELTWIGKENRPKLEPRILIEDPEKSYHASSKVSENDLFDNRLIFGDNLLALKALEQEFTGKIKCIYIDPPYNTGSAFEHYDDGIEHSLWLSLMRDRLELLWRMLRNDGSLWISIDDNECHYLKVLCDELFGRIAFVSSIAWEKDKGRRSDTDISSAHDHILLYVKNRSIWKNVRNTLPRTLEQENRYQNPDNDPRGPWLQGDNATARSGSEESYYPITTPSGRVVTPSAGRYWAFSKETFSRALSENRVYFGKKGDGMPILKRYLSEVQGGVVPRSWWPADEVGHNQEAKRDHLNKLLKDVEIFETPKPERLLETIFLISTNPSDIVLDSFAGSGTTGAVAHKMGRRWIMIELGEHCHTHIVPRLKKVVDGEDKGGITEAVDWKGGGGFRYYRLASSLLEKDKFDNWIISKKYNPAMLSEALCKIEGFTYVTTQTLTREDIQRLSEEVGEKRSLLIMCSAFRIKNVNDFPNITIKKIPQAILSKCEWGKDDYSLEIKNLPTKSNHEDIDLLPQKKPRTKSERRGEKQAEKQKVLFGDMNGKDDEK
jgi:adenine-specific DNA-methyltransferase